MDYFHRAHFIKDYTPESQFCEWCWESGILDSMAPRASVALRCFKLEIMAKYFIGRQHQIVLSKLMTAQSHTCRIRQSVNKQRSHS